MCFFSDFSKPDNEMKIGFILMVAVDTRSLGWPTLSRLLPTKQSKLLHVACIVFLFLSSFGVAYFLDMYYGRARSSETSMMASSVLYGIGYSLLVSFVSWYLNIYNFALTFILYLTSLLMFMILVGTKGYLKNSYPKTSVRETAAMQVFRAYCSDSLFEELIKLFVCMAPLVVSKKLRTVYDLIFLGAVSGATFAVVENLSVSHKGVEFALTRFVWCTISHASDCLTGCLVLAYMKSHERPYLPDRWYMYPLIVFIPVFLHGTYDLCIYIGNWDNSQSWVSYLFFLVGFVSITTAFAMMFPFRRSAVNFISKPVPIPPC